MPSPRRSERANKGIPPRRLTYSPSPSPKPSSSAESTPDTSLNRTIMASEQDQAEMSRSLAEMKEQMNELMRRCAESEAGLKAEREKREDLERQLQTVNVNPPATLPSDTVPPNNPTMIASTSSGATANQPVFPFVSTVNIPMTLSTVPPIVPSQQTYRPKMLDLPVFNGKAEQWPGFVAAFNQSTQVYGYNDLENLFRLQKCLSGAARESVECLLINPSHVGDVIKALESRFGRPEMLIHSQLQKVREILPIPDSRFELIVPFAAKVQNLATFLDMPKTQQHLSNPILINELVDKLPLFKRVEWAQHAATLEPFPTLKDLSLWVNNIAQYVHIATAISSNVEPTGGSLSRSHKPPKSNQQDPKGRRVLLQSHEPDDAAPTKATTSAYCSYCGTTGHQTFECKDFKKLGVAERWSQVKSQHMCFSCLRKGHGTTNCSRKKRCGTDGCKWIHHPLLHESDSPSSSRKAGSAVTERPRNPFACHRARTPPPETSNSLQSGPSKSVLNCLAEPDEPELLFKILPVTLFGPDKKVETYALLDNAASVSLIDEDLANELQLPGSTSTLQLTWFGSKKSTEPSRSVDLDIRGHVSNNERFPLCGVRTIRDIALPTQTLNVASLHSRYRHLKKLPLVGMLHAAPKLLIGLDNCHLSVSKRTTDGIVGAPIAAKTKLGWVVYGPTGPPVRCRMNTVLHSRVSEPEDLNEIIRDYFTTENFGVASTNTILESKDDARAKKILQSTTVRVNLSQYQTGLLWKSDNPWLPDSRPMAVNRLRSIERKMERDPSFAKEYEENIMALVSKGYARRLTTKEANRRSSKVWYLPHFAVKNPNKPGKFRLVFDAAAEANGTSLNSALLKGPDLNQPLQKTLFQFRVGAVGVCGDIREMFLQIRIQPSDQQAQRFLWRHGIKENELEEYVMMSMTFGSTCSPCSAQYIKNMNAENHANRSPEAVAAIVGHHYVDDYVISFQSSSEAIRVSSEVIAIHSEAGFELRNFSSNDQSVLSAIASGERNTSQPLRMQLDPDGHSAKILGMYWNTDTDCFMFLLKFNRVKPAIVLHSRKPSKREVLSLAMSIFDPFGILANYTLYAKLMFQELCKSSLEWDEQIPADIFAKWSQWLDELPKVRECRVPRCYSPYIATSDDVQLHLFADASEVAFAAVAYWRVRRADHSFDVSFIAGKTKGAPTKLMSVPRLELQAAILATRLLNCIRSSHRIRIDKVVMWTDSQTVMQWIRSDSRRYKPFVAHRIAEVIESTEPDQWRWLPTHENVADDATRAKYPPVYDASSRWLSGPKFLQEEEKGWPLLEETTQETNEEVRPRYVNLSVIGKPLIKISDHSSFSRLRRIAAWVLRFIANIFSTKIAGCATRRGELTVEECERGELLLCRIAQSECYPDEIEACKDKNNVERSSAIYPLSPYLGEGKVLRINGRIDAASTISADTRRPVILPRNHALTALVVAHFHQKMKHQNEGATICSIRERFWIPNLRMIVRAAAKDCMFCRIRSAKPRVPIMGPLPEDRLTPFVRPFTFTGLDYFGPILVTVGKRQEKRWVALFTCMTVRAVHLEIASDLSTDACIMCLRNFINIRGVPKRIRSDNGTNFVGASREWENAVNNFDQNAIRQELTMKGVEWIFNCPANPSSGGCWERLVQSIKRVLSVTLKETAPHVETLRSLLLEAANIVNSRPLTHVPVAHDEDEPLTPNHFLMGTPNSICVPSEENSRLLCHRKQWRVLQQLTNTFWKRWVREYLPDLTRRTKWFADVPPLRVGDLVLICDESQARCMWQRGRVCEIFPGPDGKIRTAKISTPHGELRRPVSKLAVLDVNIEVKSPVPGRFTGAGMSSSEVSISSRPAAGARPSSPQT